MEMRCYRKILRISYKDHVTNEEVRVKIQQAIGPHKDLLTIVKRRTLQWYGHVSRSSGLAKTILQGTVKGGKTRQTEEGVGRQHQGMGRPAVRQVPEGIGEQRQMEETCEIICGAPTTLPWVPTPPCAIACINIRAQDPVVHVRVRWIVETLKHQACTAGWVARLCRSCLSPGKPTRISHGRNPIRTIQL